MDMNRDCPGCRTGGTSVVRFGRYIRRSDSRHIRRFRCNACGKQFSSATFSECYRQKRRRLNQALNNLLSSGLSLRRLAILFKASRTTIAGKLVFLGEQARRRHQQALASRVQAGCQLLSIQFDDLETIEHTKCKPVTVTLAIDSKTRFIIDYAIAPIAAKGRLASISRKKYGKRADKSRSARQSMFKRLAQVVSPEAEFESDEHQHYPVLMRCHFPEATHRQFKSIRSSVGSQGELKKAFYDPLFSINHTLAMLRANINRLFRRTWCTTKKLPRLGDHLAIYVYHHNQVLLQVATRNRSQRTD